MSRAIDELVALEPRQRLRAALEDFPATSETIRNCLTLAIDARCSDTAEAVHWASLAVSLARRLKDAERFDLLPLTLAILGNSKRCTGAFREAERCFQQAWDSAARSRNAVHAELASLEASLRTDLRHFGRAERLLRQALSFHQQQGDRHEAGKILIQLGNLEATDGNYEAALQHLYSGLELIDSKVDVRLTFIGMHLVALWSIDTGALDRARWLLDGLKEGYPIYGGTLGETAYYWALGRVELAEDRLNEAASLLERIRQDLAEKGTTIDYGLLLLDLVETYCKLGRTDLARESAKKALSLTSKLGLCREAAASALTLAGLEQQDLRVDFATAIAALRADLRQLPGTNV
ncbi:MAG: hypothetical protein AAF481_18475 [Acidobacteriota bacterium]